MRQNNFYFARDIEDIVQTGINHYYSELISGNVRDTAVYVIKEEEYKNDRQYFDALPVEVLQSFGHVILKAR